MTRVWIGGRWWVHAVSMPHCTEMGQATPLNLTVPSSEIGKASQLLFHAYLTSPTESVVAMWATVIRLVACALDGGARRGSVANFDFRGKI